MAFAARRLRTVSVAVSAALVMLAGAAACGDGDPNAPPTNPIGNQGFGSKPAPATTPPPITTAPTITTAPPKPPAYPATAKAYAQAVLAAWKQNNLSRLADLTTAQVHEQIIEIPGPPNQTWTFRGCEDDATVYCAFFNGVGDWISIRIDKDKFGKAHAASAVEFNATTYPTDAIDYVEAFILAWQFGNRNRMTRLANAEITEYFTHFAPPDPYSTCDEGAAGSTYVRIYNAAGLDYTVRVVNSSLGGPNAITERPPVSATCT